MKRPEYYEENGCLHVQFGGVTETEEEEDILLTDFMQQWLHMMKSQVRSNTLDGYWYMFHKHIEPYYDARHVTLHTAKPAHFQEFVNLKYEEGYSPTSIVKFHSIVHKCLRYAVTMQLIEHNPSDHVLLPSAPNISARYTIKTSSIGFCGKRGHRRRNRHLCWQHRMDCVAAKRQVCAGAQ